MKKLTPRAPQTPTFPAQEGAATQNVVKAQTTGITEIAEQPVAQLVPQGESFEQGTSNPELPRITAAPAQQSRPNPQLLAFDLSTQATQGVQEAEAQATPGTVRPEVAALLETYDVSGEISRPEGRILKWAAELHNMLKTDGAGLESTIDKVVQRDARRMVFFLQGALKIYRKQHPGLETHYRAAKKLEDALGDFSRWNSMATQCDTHKLPQEMKDHFIEKRGAARELIKETLHENWLPDFHDGKAPAIESLLQEMGQTDWASPKKDHAFLEKFFDKRVGKLTNKQYDMNQLQGDEGLHEFRRQLRWVSVYSVALDGKVTMPGADFEALHKDPKAAVEYPAAPTFETKTLEFPEALFKKNQALIQEFGLLKDRGELLEDLSHAFVEVGLGNMHEAEAMLVPLLGEDHTSEQIKSEAKKMYKEVQNAGHFDALQQAFCD